VDKKFGVKKLNIGARKSKFFGVNQHVATNGVK